MPFIWKFLTDLNASGTIPIQLILPALRNDTERFDTERELVMTVEDAVDCRDDSISIERSKLFAVAANSKNSTWGNNVPSPILFIVEGRRGASFGNLTVFVCGMHSNRFSTLPGGW